MKHLVRFLTGWTMAMVVAIVVYGWLFPADMITPLGDTKWVLIFKFGAVFGCVTGIMGIFMGLAKDMTATHRVHLGTSNLIELRKKNER